jgi:crotonobetainyl-CoA:carnitine CoA-transferase CaiB-like acyl-CoA transferase
MKPLESVRVLTLAVNLPGPLAAARLYELGAAVIKVEPPEGDPLAHASPGWYSALHDGMEVRRLNLKESQDRSQLDPLLLHTDLLITATRPAALQRLGFSWPELHARYPRLCQVAIVGYPAPHEDRPGHDLTYQAKAGLLVPPHLPRACVADWGGAQEAVSAALSLLLARERGYGSSHIQVSLAEAAERFAQPLNEGLTIPGGVLGGGFAGYNLYRTRDGWIAVGALEPHFRQKLANELGLASLDREQLQELFMTRTGREWESWGNERDLPLVALRDSPS